MDLFTGLTFDWGFTAGDIFSNGMTIVGALAGFVLLGIAIKFAPALIGLIRKAVEPGSTKH